MFMRLCRGCITLFVLLFVTLEMGAARADKALVVGVNKYPRLLDANLEGSVNDANSIAQGLRASGFTTVVEITDQKATKSGILKALSDMKRICKPSEQFVFFYAGHGSMVDNVGSVLLPSDASEDVYLSAEDLYRAIKDVPANNRTVLLDACFSGGMSRSFDPTRRWRTRFYPLHTRSVARGASDKPNGADTTQHLSGKTDVCYFTAAKRNETAKEFELGGVKHGVFSFYLAPLLIQKPPIWKRVEEQVNGNVAKDTDDTQHPTLTPAFKNLPFLPGKQQSPPPDSQPPTRTIWDDYLASNPKPERLQLLLDPNTTPFIVGTDERGTHFKLTVKVGTESGYLVLIERGVSGSINLLFPLPQNKGNIERTRVAAGQSLRFPPDDTEFYDADMVGTERVNAILFTDKRRAMALLNAFPADGKIATIQGARDMRIVETHTSPFYTSDVEYEVVAP